MGKRVYDPIHDVFQDREESDAQSSVTGRVVEDEDDSNTESEETNSPQKEAIVPSVATNRKKMKESSKYNRHLKKPDGEFFTRRDLQFHFLTRLLTDDRPLFTNLFKEVYAKSVVPLPTTEGKTVDVTDASYDARTFVFNDKLTFSQLYILTLASSTKCSKVLRDKLLLDHQAAFSTCILALLVNFGRLNTTINFYLEMTSQLRTFHSVPCLQYRVADLKSLQDTPRLKSILKNLSVGNEPLDLAQLYESPGMTNEKANVVNLLFTMCDNVTLVNMKLLSKYVEGHASLFNILDSPDYEPEDRCNVVLWLLYIHTETDLSPESIQQSIKLFTTGDKLPLRRATKEYDQDPQDEYDFGLEQKAKRREFLKRTKHDESDEKEGEEEEEEEEEEQEEEEEEEEEDETIQEMESQEDEVVEPVTPRKRRETGKEKREPKRRKVETVVKQESASEDVTRIEGLIELDRKKIVGKLGRHQTKDQQTFVQDLLSAQKPVKMKRRDLGLVRIFNEYEDIPMASVIGIRGKKRKKFKDDVLGFETDYLRSFAAAKKMMLNDQWEEQLGDFFQL